MALVGKFNSPYIVDTDAVKSVHRSEIAVKPAVALGMPPISGKVVKNGTPAAFKSSNTEIRI